MLFLIDMACALTGSFIIGYQAGAAYGVAVFLIVSALWRPDH